MEVFLSSGATGASFTKKKFLYSIQYICRVGKLLTYIFFFIVWLDTTSLNQLAKLPVLVSHYLEHHHTRSDLSVSQFLTMHYGGDDGDDSDNDRDMQLPFKKIDFTNFQVLFSPQVKGFVVKQCYAPEKSSYPFTVRCSWLNPTLKSLFRPPRG